LQMRMHALNQFLGSREGGVESRIGSRQRQFFRH
jgi:hypothetical protein